MDCYKGQGAELTEQVKPASGKTDLGEISPC